MKNSILVIATFIIFSCKNEKHSTSAIIEFKDSLNVEVNKVDFVRGYVLVNNKYLINSASLMVNEPLLSKIETLEFREVYNLALENKRINEILPPYKIFKKRNSHYFRVFKNNNLSTFILNTYN